MSQVERIVCVCVSCIVFMSLSTHSASQPSIHPIICWLIYFYLAAPHPSIHPSIYPSALRSSAYPPIYLTTVSLWHVALVRKSLPLRPSRTITRLESPLSH